MGVTSFCFIFEEKDECEHQKTFPHLGEKLDIVVTPRDRITGADLSYCQGKQVWIDATPIDYRRAKYLWRELLKPENLPAAIFAQTEKGLTVFQPYERRKQVFSREQKND